MTKPILCLDFDGVIHSYASGWQGADVCTDPPVEGTAGFLRQAVELFRVNVFSSRSHRHGGIPAMQRYVQDLLHGHFHDQRLCDYIYSEIEWPMDKPPAMLTIDDRAIRFEGRWPDPQQLLQFKPWNKP